MRIPSPARGRAAVAVLSVLKQGRETLSEQDDKPKRSRLRKKRYWIPAVIVVLFIIVGVASGGGSKKGTGSTSPVASATTSASSTTSASRSPASATTSASRSPTTSAAPTSNLTVSQQNAVNQAKNYLSLQGFSKQGLIDQLSSSAGDKYSVHDATVAVNSLHEVDWNAEAVKSAKEYMKLSSFSCSGLVDQLSSSAGSQYTAAQAKYAATKVGLC